MNVHDKVGKAIWQMVEGIKDQVGANVVAAASSGKIKIEGVALNQIVSLIGQSIDQAYHSRLRFVTSEVEAAMIVSPLDSKKKR